MGKKRSRKSAHKSSDDPKSSTTGSTSELAQSPEQLQPMNEGPTPSTTVAPEEQRSRDAEAMDAMLETLLSKKLQIVVKEKQKSQENESKIQIVGQTPDIFDRNKLDLDQLINKEGETEYVLPQREVFQAYACQVCKSVKSTDETKLKRCINCKMIFYCSKEHQIEHWSTHKDLCKVICKLCKSEGLTYLFENAAGLSADEYRQYRIQRVDQCARMLSRPIDLWEREIFYYTPVCQTCHVANRDQLKACDKCFHVNFCKPEHFNVHHQKWCASFCLYRDIIFYQAENGMIQPSLPNKIFSHYKPLSENMRMFFPNAFGSGICMQWNRLTYSIITDVATCPLSALFALQKCNLSPGLESRKELTIHLAGAELHFEADTINKWEIFLLHLLPNLITLNITFIGPELKKRPLDMIEEELCCRNCKQAGKKVIYEFHPNTFYHDYAKSASYKHPDLICAFNAGLYRSTGYAGNDTWLPTIKVMLEDATIPVVVTAYTAHELPHDVARMKEQFPANFHVILEPTENPFSSSKPSLNFINEEEVPIIFKNFYISIVRSL